MKSYDVIRFHNLFLVLCYGLKRNCSSVQWEFIQKKTALQDLTTTFCILIKWSDMDIRINRSVMLDLLPGKSSERDTPGFAGAAGCGTGLLIMGLLVT